MYIRQYINCLIPTSLFPFAMFAGLWYMDVARLQCFMILDLFLDFSFVAVIP
jgi:hypothetical protein